MTPQELELFLLAVKYRKQYLDSNPEVGMGPTIETICRQVAAELSFSVSEDDIGWVATLATGFLS